MLPSLIAMSYPVAKSREELEADSIVSLFSASTASRFKLSVDERATFDEVNAGRAITSGRLGILREMRRKYFPSEHDYAPPKVVEFPSVAATAAEKK